MHSSRIHTTHLLTVSTSMHCAGGCLVWGSLSGGAWSGGVCSGGIPGPRGALSGGGAWSGWILLWGCLIQGVCSGGVPGPRGALSGGVPGLGGFCSGGAWSGGSAQGGCLLWGVYKHALRQTPRERNDRQVQKYYLAGDNKRALTCYLLCKRPGGYHSTSKTHVRNRIFKLSPIHTSVIYQIP